MDEHERDLFERGIRAALGISAGPGIDSALRELGWYEALRTDAPAAISALYELHGELNTESSLDAVMAHILCPDEPSAALVLPRFGSLDPPARRDGDALIVRGIGSGSVTASDQVVVASRIRDPLGGYPRARMPSTVGNRPGFWLGRRERNCLRRLFRFRRRW